MSIIYGVYNDNISFACLDAAQELGAMHRLEFLQIFIQKEPNVWFYDNYDKIVEEYKRRKIPILGLLGKNVPWNSAGTDPNANLSHYPPKDMSKWLNYVYNTVSKYCDYVKYWEI